MTIPATDLRIDIYHNACPGEPFYVRVTHVPTGLTAQASSKVEQVAREMALGDLEIKLTDHKETL